MKRFYSVFLAFAMFWSSCCLSLAFASAPAVNAPDRELSFTTITMGDDAMVIPVIVETSKQQMRYTRSGGIYQDAAQAATYYIPVTEEGMAYNEAYIQAAQSAQLEGSIENFDPKHYYKIKSTICYTLYNSLDGAEPDSLVGMDMVSITRSQDPVGLDWDILGIKISSISIGQNGLTDRGHGIISGNGTWVYNQIKTYENISWGTDTVSVSVPSNWYPVMLINCTCIVRHTITIQYSDGNKTWNLDHELKL